MTHCATFTLPFVASYIRQCSNILQAMSGNKHERQLASHSKRRGLMLYLETLGLAAAKTDIIPGGNVVGVRTEGTGTCIGACIYIRDTTGRDACRWGYWVFGESTHLVKYAFACANSLAHKDIVAALVSACCPSSLLLRPPFSAHPHVSYCQRRDRRPYYRPPPLHHRCTPLELKHGSFLCLRMHHWKFHE